MVEGTSFCRFYRIEEGKGGLEVGKLEKSLERIRFEGNLEEVGRQ